MSVTLTAQDFAELKSLTAKVIETFGDDWPLEYDTDFDEVVCRFEDENAPFTNVFIELFRTSQWPDGEKTSPLAEFLAASVKVVPALLAEVERLRAERAFLIRAVEVPAGVPLANPMSADRPPTSTELAERRKALGLNQVKLGVLAGISTKAVARVEAGDAGVGSPSYNAVCAALDAAEQAALCDSKEAGQ